MSIKSRMHPRSIYKEPPNFKELAIHYPDFRKYVKQELSGRVIIDYSDQNAVKELTRTLLKKDFNLDVDINESRLIPRIPLCLNYLLWVEDLLVSLEKTNKTDIIGIDIGTGGVCIYSLLAARKGWKMLATEADELNFRNAAKNIMNNKLENSISLKFVSDSNQLLQGVIGEQNKFDFCMCNPPFFDYNEKPQNRTFRRKQLETVASETPMEISTEGGEISFLTKLIEESERLRDQVKIYTTLVGKKSDFLFLKRELQKHSPKSMAVTEFCQGRTMRWGLAWTFLDINLRCNSGPQKIKTKKSKSKPPLQFILPNIKVENMESVMQTTKELLNGLKIKFRQETKDIGFIVCFKAYENTWSHQRQRIRLLARTGGNVTQENSVKSDTSEDCNMIVDDDECPGPKRPRLDTKEMEQTEWNDKPLIVEGSIIIKAEGTSVFIEMIWISGCKDSFYQIFQYLKNHWSKNVTVR